MIDQLRQLAIFAKTIDHGSFRGAAKDLNLSPSVVSHHVSQLEAHLGVALIYRTTRKLSLTPDGERLLSATRNMLSAVEGELADISSAGGAPSGELRITVPSILSQSRLTIAIASFVIKYPNVRVLMNFTDELKELVESGLDIAIRMSPKGHNTSTTRILLELDRRLIAAPSYIEKQPSYRHPKDLQDWDWLSLSPVHNRGLTLIRGSKDKARIKPTSKVTSNDARALYCLAKAGAGVTALPEFLAKPDAAEGNVVFVLPGWNLDPLKAFAEWPANAPREGLVTRFVDHLDRELSAGEHLALD